MRRIASLIALICIFANSDGATLRAQDKTGEAAKAPSYKGHVHVTEDGKHHHKEATFDLSKKEDLNNLVSHLKKGEVEELAQVKELNPMALTWDLGLWAIVVFVLLLLVLRKLAWGPMLEGLKKREETIRSAVEEAKLAREETMKVRAEFQAEMAKAYEKIPQMLEEARRDALRLAEEMRVKAQAEILADRQRLRREIETARDQALQEIWNQAAQLATLISAKAIKRSLTVDDHRRLVDDALNELRQEAGASAKR